MDSSSVTIILWLLCGVLGAVINNSKGKSIGWGVAGGLLFGVFGLVFLALHNPGVSCIKCREKVKAGSLICRHCGTNFTVPAGWAG